MVVRAMCGCRFASPAARPSSSSETPFDRFAFVTRTDDARRSSGAPIARA
jgi:hypothetical protein